MCGAASADICVQLCSVPSLHTDAFLLGTSHPRYTQTLSCSMAPLWSRHRCPAHCPRYTTTPSFLASAATSSRVSCRRVRVRGRVKVGVRVSVWVGVRVSVWVGVRVGVWVRVSASELTQG